VFVKLTPPVRASAELGRRARQPGGPFDEHAKFACYGKPACAAPTVAISMRPLGAADASSGIEVGAVIMNRVLPSSPPSMQA
jgi:hypothetical protein